MPTTHASGGMPRRRGCDTMFTSTPRVVPQAIRAIATSPIADVFIPTFLKGIQGLVSHAGVPRTQLQLYRLTMVIALAWDWEADAAPAFWKQMVEVQVRIAMCGCACSHRTLIMPRAPLPQFYMLDSLSSANRRLQSSAAALLHTLLRRAPGTLDLMAGELPRLAVGPGTCRVAASLLLQFVTKPANVPVAKYTNELKPVFLDAFARTVLQAVDKAPADAFDAYAPLLRTLRKKDVQVLAPHIEAALKQGADDTLTPIAKLFSLLNIDLSRYMETLVLPAVASACKSRVAAVRDAAPAFLLAAVRKCSAAESLTAVVAELGAMVTGKKGAVPMWQHRYCMVDCLSSVVAGLATDVSAEGAAAVAEAAVGFLTTLGTKESHEETRCKAVESLGSWLAVLDAIPAATLAMLEKGLKPAMQHLAGSYTRCIADAAASAGAAKAAKPLVAALCEVLARAKAKPALVHDAAVYAIHALLRMGTASTGVAKTVVKEKAYLVLTSPSSFLHQSPFLKTAGHSPASVAPYAEALKHLASAVALLLQHHTDVVSTLSDLRKQAKIDADLVVSTPCRWQLHDVVWCAQLVAVLGVLLSLLECMPVHH